MTAVSSRFPFVPHTMAIPDEKAGTASFEPEQTPIWAKECTNLANERLGATVIFATDEWFAPAECLLNPGPPVFDPDAYSPQGKVCV
jgi:allantoicase